MKKFLILSSNNIDFHLSFFDLDFDNFMFLMNQLLKKRTLSDFDREYYKKIIQLRKNEFQEKRRKQKESYQNFKKKKNSQVSLDFSFENL